MQFVNLSIKNFFSIKDMVIGNLNEPGLYLVTGSNLDRSRSNGAGKSSIFEAICWCLYGRTTKMGVRGQAAIVRRGAGGPCTVSMHILDGDASYVIVRERDKNKATLQILKDGSDVSCKSVSDSNALIEGIVGLKFDEFIRGHYLPQRSPIPFGQMTDKDLKEFFLERLLDVGWVRAAHENAKEDHNALTSSIKNCDSAIFITKARLEDSEKKIEELQEKDNDFTAHVKKSINAYYHTSTKLSEQADLLHTQQKVVSSEIGALKKDLEQLNEDDIRMEYDEIINKTYVLETKITEVKRIEDALNDDESVCPTCGSVLDSEGRKELERLISGNDIKSLKNELRAFKLKLESLATKMSYIRESKQRIMNLQSNSDVSEIEKELWKVNEKIAQLKEKVNPYPELIKKEADARDIHAHRLEELTKELEHLKDSLERLEFWTHGFSAAGVQSFLLDAITPVLNERLNECLQVLTDGEFTARFNTVKQLQSGDYRERFSLAVKHVTGANEYSVLSGGEAQRIDLATSIVMSDLMRSRSNKQLDFLCFDEPLRSLDQDGIDSFLEFVRDHYSGVAVYLITHTEVDPTLFHQHLHVEKKNGVTTLRSQP